VLSDSHDSTMIEWLWACGLIRLHHPLQWVFIQFQHIMWGLSEVCQLLDSHAGMLIVRVVGLRVN